MSANLENLRRGFEIYSRGDFDALMELIDEDVVVERPGGQSPIEGRAAFRSFMEPDAFESQEFEVREMVENGDRIFVRAHSRAVGAGSGVELNQEVFHVWTMREGRGVRLVATFDAEEARREAGLLERPAS